ncbi:magnesium/cobalt transporter CorA [Methanospirillum lacunae]|uniref:Magnesium transport protein CorA n=1 Tax=Methanospirillum lacunae TaxID=668570 RepID=A0A2V2N5H8_9EURY|nr:magnesium/cobalt transporter CorA [Methanospirillum lacunae]PWR73765.1 magnesium and cobalt transport protein CorA [Methanospirillum lacunae]
MHFEQNISRKTGMPPGTPIYIGDEAPKETTIHLLVYSDQNISGFEQVSPEELTTNIQQGSNAWISITGLRDVALIEQVLNSFSIHPLVTEDILNTRTRSKIEEFDEYLFIVMTHFQRSEDEMHEEQVSLILTNNILITCSNSIGMFPNIENRIKRSTSRFRTNGIDYLAYTIIDTIVDGYFFVLEDLEERVEDLEDEIVNNPGKDTINHVQDFRRDLIWFRRKIWSLRELITRLERTDSLLIKNTTHLYLRDVYDHTIKIAEDVDVYREMAEGLMEIYLSKISNNTNEIMKVLTIIANIFIPLTFIAGIYGMNFEYMPELTSPYGYPAVLLVMSMVSATMLLYFRRKEWI